MARTRKTTGETPPADTNGFDVPTTSENPPPPAPAPIEADSDEADDLDETETPPPPQVHTVESPEQRKLMREKRIAKAEEEQLRRLTRQYPVIAKLVFENQSLKQQLEKPD